MKRINVACALGMTLLVSACATPRDQCINEAAKEYNALMSAITTTQQTIARGYAVHRQTVPYTYSGTCFSDTFSYPCPQTGYRTQETPVAVNMDEERRRLTGLQGRLSKVKDHAQQAVQRCQATYPE